MADDPINIIYMKLMGTTVPPNLEQLNQFKKCSINSIFSVVCLIISGVVIYYASTDPKLMQNRSYLYTIFTILPILIASYLVLPFFYTPMNAYKSIIIGILIITILAGFYFFSLNTNPTSVLWVTFILGALLFFILLLTLAIIYKIGIRLIKNIKGWGGFFIRLIFYLPCLLIDFVEYILSELKVTPNVVFVLFVLEILVILLYVYIPKLIEWYRSRYSNQILTDPVFLTSTTILKSPEPVKSKSMTDPIYYNANYTITMWIYVNPHNNNVKQYAKETTIFHYGVPGNSAGKPRIAYHYDTESGNDKYIIYTTDNELYDNKGVFSITLPNQKWNQFAFTYNDSQVDVYINGNLEYTYKFENNMPIYSLEDKIIVGSGDGTTAHMGLHGAICNICYYKTPIREYDIVMNYNSLMNKSIPL